MNQQIDLVQYCRNVFAKSQSEQAFFNFGFPKGLFDGFFMFDLRMGDTLLISPSHCREFSSTALKVYACLIDLGLVQVWLSC